MSYISGKFHLSEYADGQTPFINDNGYWQIGNTPTNVKAKGVDGTSFSGVVEYYTATLADDRDAPDFDPSAISSIWKQKIEDTGFGTKDENGVDYKYLWNVEGIKSIDQNGKETIDYLKDAEDNIIVDLYMTYTGGRIPKKYISYYATNTTNSAPGKEPSLVDNGNSLSLESDSKWKESSSYKGSADADIYLFEISFVEYAEKDENGQNLYAKISGPTMIGHNGTNGGNLEVQYQNATSSSALVETSWTGSMPTAESGKKTFMRQKLSTQTNWSAPIQISAEDGSTPTIEIVTVDGIKYWKINGETTTIKAEGQDGDTPEVKIENGVWVIDGSSTGINATGPAGKDGSNIEYVYYRSESAVESWEGHEPNSNEEKGWKNSPQGITATYKYEYMSVRTKPAGIDTQWTAFSTPVIWSKWGDKGMDGDGVEYKYYLKNEEVEPSYSASDTNWKDEPQGVTSSNRFEYVAIIKTKHKEDGTTEVTNSVTLWNKYVASGQNNATIYLYQKKYSTLPSLPIGTLMYSFYDKNFTSETTEYLNGWQLSIPNGSDPLYVIAAHASSTENYDEISKEEWSQPEKLTGSNGINSATVYLYQRSSQTITQKPTGDFNYSFKNGNLVGLHGANLHGWSTNIPFGDNPCYRIHAVAMSAYEYSAIKEEDWSDIQLFVQNGEDAVSYNVILTPNIINITTNPEAEISGQIIKITGDKQEDITNTAINSNQVFSRFTNPNTDWILQKVSADDWDNNYRGLEIAYCVNKNAEDTRFPKEGQSVANLPESYGDVKYIYYYGTAAAIEDGSIEEIPDELTKSDIYIYYRSEDDGYSSQPPELPDESSQIKTIDNNDIWTTYSVYPLPPNVSGEWSYVYRAICTKQYLNGATTYSNFRNRELYKVYHPSIDYQEYARYYTLTRGDSDGLAYDNNGKLYITAKSLEIENDEGQTLFEAIGMGDNRHVTIAGWDVEPDCIWHGIMGQSYSMYLSPVGKQADYPIGGSDDGDWCITCGTNFGVTSGGTIYSTGACFSNATVGNNLFVRSILDFTGYSITNNASVGQITRTKTEYVIPATAFTYDREQSYTWSPQSIDIDVEWNGQVWTGDENDFFLITYSGSGGTVTNQKYRVSEARQWQESSQGARFSFEIYDSSVNATRFSISAHFTQKIETEAFQFGGSLIPGNIAGLSLGASNLPWSAVFAEGIFETSDQNKKEEYLSFNEIPDIYDQLIPRIYYFKDDPYQKTHFGFYAQEVEQALQGFTTSDLGMIARSENGDYSLNYTELIALNTWQIQKLRPAIAKANQEIESLKLEIQQLRAELQNLQNR